MKLCHCYSLTPFLPVQQRTAQLLSFKCLIERQTGRMISGNQVKALEPEEVGQWVTGVEVELMGQTSLRMIEFIGTQIRSLEKAAQAKIKLLPDYDRLKQIPGIGEILNLVIMLETGPITRFAGAGQYVSYCRGAKSEKLSNGRKKGENNRKCGNKYLAWAWMEAANFALRYSPEIKQWYQRKLARCGKVVVARKALAAKLAKAAYYMLKNQEAFKLEKLLG